MKKSGIIAAPLLTMLVLAALIAGWFLGASSLAIDVLHWRGNPLPPCFIDASTCGGHLLGTDENGRDMVARLIVGARYTLGIAFGVLLLELAVAAALAALARYRLFGAILRTLAHGLAALPRVPLLFTVFLFIQYLLKANSPSPVLIVVVVGLALWPRAFQALRSKAGVADMMRRSLSDLITAILLAPPSTSLDMASNRRHPHGATCS